jgi:glycosyltransferase involved in cell wall biosynthesis
VKILWLSPTFLHPTTRGGQIRTLGTLRQLHRRHEIHYVGLYDGRSAEAVQRSSEYCSQVYPIPHSLTPRTSPRFWWEVAGGLFSRTPALLARKRSPLMRERVAEVLRGQRFDRVVCDFLTPTINLPAAVPYVVFQHNVETMIWRRYAEQASDPVRRAYFRLQARRLFAYERQACRRAAHVIAVSAQDAAVMAKDFGVENLSWVPTGVDVDYFLPPASPDPLKAADLVFIGSMDWMPNIDGVRWFVREALPLIRRRRPACSLAIVGRTPSPEIRALAAADPLIKVTGTVDDVRPYLWAGSLSVVPLRIGGGTRLKIYEAMAAHLPVVSTTIGAEGLDAVPPRHIRIADSPAALAGECLSLLENPAERAAVAANAAEFVRSRFSWECVAARFEEILAAVPWPAIP